MPPLDKSSANPNANLGAPFYALDPLLEATRRRGDACAIRYFDGEISYRDLDLFSSSIAAWLQDKNVRKGDRVCIVTQNTPHFVIALLAIWKCGAVAMPCNPAYRRNELEKLIADADPSVILVENGCRDGIEQTLRSLRKVLPLLLIDPADYRIGAIAEQNFPDASHDDFFAIAQSRRVQTCAVPQTTARDPALLLYTSGTTGRPKGAILTYQNLLHNAEVCRTWFSLNDQSRVLAIAPLFHIVGIVCAVISSVAAGSVLVLDYRFNAKGTLETIRSTRPTFTIGAITAFSALMNNPDASPEDFASFHLIYSGGAPVPVTVSSEFARRFGVQIRTAFGMTETAAPTHFTPAMQSTPIHPTRLISSVGVPVDGTQARVIDELGKVLPPDTVGELLVKGPQVMAGYWNRPQETAEALADGWLHTGDMAVIDLNGWCYIVDRKKDMICASGFKIWPGEVEEALYAMPGVREVVVVGKPDDYRGETVKAYLSLDEGADLSADDVALFVRDRLASYKCPTEIEILPDLPKTATGKLQRLAMREQAAHETRS